ncbi:hypothetical protein LXA43DRAFT_1089772 [Ganoderma leucocontextum]|nr:hypothetical protein LXA43DRAFT_1089772 [Ganoderma leucocontextum]
MDDSPVQFVDQCKPNGSSITLLRVHPGSRNASSDMFAASPSPPSRLHTRLALKACPRTANQHLTTPMLSAPPLAPSLPSVSPNASATQVLSSLRRKSAVMLKRAVELSASAMQDQSSSTTPGNANTSSASTEAANVFHHRLVGLMVPHHQVRRTGPPRLGTPPVNAKNEERPRDKDTKRLKHLVSQIPRASTPFFQSIVARRAQPPASKAPSPQPTTPTTIPISSPKSAPALPTPEQLVAPAGHILAVYRAHVSHTTTPATISSIRKYVIAARSGFALPTTFDYNVDLKGRVPRDQVGTAACMEDDESVGMKQT